jgi:hypothetical protein
MAYARWSLARRSEEIRIRLHASEPLSEPDLEALSRDIDSHLRHLDRGLHRTVDLGVGASSCRRRSRPLARAVSGRVREEHGVVVREPVQKSDALRSGPAAVRRSDGVTRPGRPTRPSPDAR